MYLTGQFDNVPASRRFRQMGSYPYRRRRLGALTPDQAAQVAMPTSTISSTAGFTQSVYNYIVQSAAAGQLVAPLPTSCTTGQAGVSLKPALLSVASGVGLKLAPLAGPAAPIVALGSAAAGLFAAIFASHAAKVAKEQQVVCAAVPAANDSLLAIDQAVQGGVLTPAQGQAALAQLSSEFSSQVSSIIKMSPSQCDAACVWTKMLRAVVAQKASVYADIISAQTAAAAPGTASPGAAPAAPAGTIASPAFVDQIAATIGLPTWGVYALAAVIVWELF